MWILIVCFFSLWRVLNVNFNCLFLFFVTTAQMRSKCTLILQLAETVSFFKLIFNGLWLWGDSTVINTWIIWCCNYVIKKNTYANIYTYICNVCTTYAAKHILCTVHVYCPWMPSMPVFLLEFCTIVTEDVVAFNSTSVLGIFCVSCFTFRPFSPKINLVWWMWKPPQCGTLTCRCVCWASLEMLSFLSICLLHFLLLSPSHPRMYGSRDTCETLIY